MTFTFFSKIRVIFNIFYCFRMFVNKRFTYLRRAYFRSKKYYNANNFGALFLCKNGIVGRFSDLH